jgi:putative hydrolase of the HAD superfamily
MIECYRMHIPQIEFHPDARAAIHAWRGRFRLGLISDGTLAMQQAKVKALGLDPLLDEIILTGQWGPAYGKPHARAFELMETRLNLHAQALVYIADNCGNDFVAPRQWAGETCGVRRPWNLPRRSAATRRRTRACGSLSVHHDLSA